MKLIDYLADYSGNEVTTVREISEPGKQKVHFLGTAQLLKSTIHEKRDISDKEVVACNRNRHNILTIIID